MATEFLSPSTPAASTPSWIQGALLGLMDSRRYRRAYHTSLMLTRMGSAGPIPAMFPMGWEWVKKGDWSRAFVLLEQ
jgi:hypothetical protein